MLRRTVVKRGGGGSPSDLPLIVTPQKAALHAFRPLKPAPPPNTHRACVVLSGCGVFDGAEITETVSTTIALEQHHFKYEMAAPARPQFHVFNHQKGEVDESKQQRNLLEESARIFRGPVTPLEEINPANFDCLIFPGGFGVMKNLSTFAVAEQGKVHQDVADLIVKFYEAKRPIGALCIAPVLLAATIGPIAKSKNLPAPQLTLGDTTGDAQTLAASFGADLKKCGVSDMHRCPIHKLVTSPAYMLGDASPKNVFEGVSLLVNELHKMVDIEMRRGGASNQCIAV